VKVIAFLGSPRKGGNSETLLKEAVGGTGLDVEVFDLCELNIEPCKSCGDCEETGECVIDDDMDDMKDVYDAIRKADRIIFSTPVFFMGLPAQAKAMVDRCQALWAERYLLKKSIPVGEHGRKGLLLIVGGMKMEQGVKCAEASLVSFLRSVSVAEHRTLSYTGIDAKGAILKHQEALKEAYEAGRELVS
jgi:multimeric flavodoxin WrbA